MSWFAFGAACYLTIGLVLWGFGFWFARFVFNRLHRVGGQLDAAHALLPVLHRLKNPWVIADFVLFWPAKLPRAVRYGAAGWRGELP